MAIEMILRHVEHDRDMRAKRVERFELKTGYFRYGDPVFAKRAEIYHRRTDIPASFRLVPALFQYAFEHGNGRRFSVRTRHRHDRTTHIPRRKLRFSHDRFSAAFERDRKRMIDGNSWA